MQTSYITGKQFVGQDFAKNPLAVAEYEACDFDTCNFSSHDLQAFAFAGCVFKNCNLSLAKINKAAFRDVHFISCKLLGVRFDTCNPFLFEAKFDSCQLNLASFYKLDLSRCSFKKCNFTETDFTQADMRNLAFNGCEFDRAVFEGSHLEAADFSGATGFDIDPEKNFVKGACFSAEGARGLLAKYKLRWVD